MKVMNMLLWFLLSAGLEDPQVQPPPPPPPPPPPSVQPSRWGIDSETRIPLQGPLSMQGLCQHPSFKSLEKAAKKYLAAEGSEATVFVSLDYDARGRVTHATIRRSSGIEALDAEVLAWASKVHVCAHAPGSGVLPFLMSW